MTLAIIFADSLKVSDHQDKIGYLVMAATGSLTAPSTPTQTVAITLKFTRVLTGLLRTHEV